MNKVADSTEKVLPGNAVLTAKENILPASSSRIGQPSVFMGPSTNDSLPAEAAASASDFTAAPVMDMNSRALDRAQDMIALQSTRLIETKSDSLHMVLKPGAGMELSLELRQHGDAIEARAVLERGDLGALSHHWPELQQRLEQRGIRLAPLTGGENFINHGSSSGFQQSQREFAGQDPLEASAFAEFALAQSIIQPSMPAPAFAATGRGWETWA